MVALANIHVKVQNQALSGARVRCGGGGGRVMWREHDVTTDPINVPVLHVNAGYMDFFTM